MFPILFLLFGAVGGSAPRRCHEEDSCFPTTQDYLELRTSLEGQLLFPHDAEYKNVIAMHNVITTKYPYVVAAVKSALDVQKSVRFARKHNLRVTVKCSGHDYNGRSTAHDSFMIYTGYMNNTHVNLKSARNAAGEITSESGNTWTDIYTEVAKYNRVVVGGSAHTVTIGGYTLGGGHSPMSRMFGLAVDNLLEVEMVTANGEIIQANDIATVFHNADGSTRVSNDTSIFWALRGGGGGTFGLVTKFTYRLHYPASAVVMFQCFYPIILQNGTNIGYDILQFIGNLIPNLPREWGGYLLITPSVNKYSGSFGTLGLFLNHYGPFDTVSRSYMDKLKNYLPDIQMYCGYTNFSTFLEYENNAHDVEWYATSLFNTLMQNDSFTSDWINFTIDSVVKSHPIPNSGVRFTGTLIGGRVSEVDEDDTPVHPGMRTSLMTLSGSLSWDPTDTKVDWRKAIEMSKSLEERLHIYGYGMYPNESGPNVTDWKNNFWGNNYHRLLDIKRMWDPEHFFYCTQCVGSEEAHLSVPLNPFG